MAKIEYLKDVNMDDIAAAMHYEVREILHDAYAPCSKIFFILEYVNISRDFMSTLRYSFNLDFIEEPDFYIDTIVRDLCTDIENENSTIALKAISHIVHFMKDVQDSSYVCDNKYFGLVEKVSLRIEERFGSDMVDYFRWMV